MGRFAKLADTLKGMAAFRVKYRIPDNVELQHCELGMEIPMGRVTRDFLINFRLSPTQCSPNLFRVLDSVDMIN